MIAAWYSAFMTRGVVACGVAWLLFACGGEERQYGNAPGGEGGEPSLMSGGSAGSGGMSAGPSTGGTTIDGAGNGGSSGEPDCGDTLSDEENCGSCGHQCAVEELCTEGECTAPPAHCDNDEQDGDETDVNCGGSCAPCEVDESCESGDDCSTGFCSAGSQCAQPSCEDGALNGAETGEDCGGEICRALNLLCDNDEACAEDGDCKTGFCHGGTCRSPSCDDEVLNQGETAVDCGGPVCRLNTSPLGTCSNGKACDVHEDCTSLYCGNGVCAKPTCEDGAKNQDETGQDCGGPTCRLEPNGRCPDAAGCLVHEDCGSGFCSPGKLCSPAGCGNSNKDPNETDVDCGGDGCRATKPCALGLSCVIHADCASGSCKSGKCVAATCSDGIKNQGETAVDCGGPTCSAAGKTCPNATACEVNADCTDGFCSNKLCSGACKGKPPTLGCPCTPNGSLACAGAAQSLKLICEQGAWVQNGVPCPQGFNCSQATGACAAVIPACVSAGAGKSYCDTSQTPSRTSLTCNADLVATTATSCSGICSAGACQAARCGDGVKHNGEQCDDGNAAALDGCESTCKTSRVLAVALSNGGTFTCVLTEGGYVRCWGANDLNQLGLGDTVFRQTQEPFELKAANGTSPAGPIDLGGTASAITVGGNHACALLTDGSARCWGDNSQGQLGLGNTTAQTNKVPAVIGRVKVATARKITSISAGSRHTCAVLDNGTATCWGQNASGELGLGSTTAVSASQTPEQTGAISLGASAISIGAGSNSTCALLAGGKVRCWGNGALGQLGTGAYLTQGNIGDNELPSSSGDAGLVPLAGPPTALAVASSHACVLLSSGSLQCWGQNSAGACGIGDPSNIGDDESPAVYGGAIFAQGEVVQSFAVGTGATCAVVAGQGLRCYGLNKRGQAGYAHIDNLGTTNGTVPALLPEVALGAGRSLKSVAMGSSYTCALLDNDSVKCWGWNHVGQLGFGVVSGTPDYIGGTAATTPDKLDPIRIFGP